MIEEAHGERPMLIRVDAGALVAVVVAFVLVVFVVIVLVV